MVAKSQKQNAENKQKFQNTKLDESFDAFDQVVLGTVSLI